MLCHPLSLPSDLNRAMLSVDIDVRVGSRREFASKEVGERVEYVTDVVRLLSSPQARILPRQRPPEPPQIIGLARIGGTDHDDRIPSFHALPLLTKPIRGLSNEAPPASRCQTTAGSRSNAVVSSTNLAIPVPAGNLPIIFRERCDNHRFGFEAASPSLGANLFNHTVVWRRLIPAGNDQDEASSRKQGNCRAAQWPSSSSEDILGVYPVRPFLVPSTTSQTTSARLRN